MDTYHDVAPHIRGHLSLASATGRSGDGWPHYWYEVVNTHTGEVLIYSDGYGFESTLRECSHATAAARAAWFWSLRRKALL